MIAQDRAHLETNRKQLNPVPASQPASSLIRAEPSQAKQLPSERRLLCRIECMLFVRLLFPVDGSGGGEFVFSRCAC